MNVASAAEPALEIEASNLLCVPIDAWPLVEPYAHLVVQKCRAKERILHAAARALEAQTLHDLRTKLQARLGIR